MKNNQRLLAVMLGSLMLVSLCAFHAKDFNPVADNNHNLQVDTAIKSLLWPSE